METIAALEWLFATLAGDATLAAMIHGIYDAPAPQGTASPWITFYNFTPGIQTMVTKGTIIMVTSQVLVKIEGETGEYAALTPAARRVKTLLHDKAAAFTDSAGHAWYVHQSDLVEQNAPPPNIDNGVDYREIDLTFRIVIAPS